jgi:selenocysteine-specific elongation factor
VVAVSAVTGRGLDALRAALAGAAAGAAPRTPREGPSRLWVDRVFEMRGFGTVATGTLTGAPLAVGETLALLPGGGTARVRGLQRFGEAAERVPPGARCAVNLGGVARDALGRGTLLTSPGALAPTARVDVALDWLAGAPPLGPGTASVELLVGTAERRARLAPLGTDRLEPGRQGLARLHVEGEPLALLPGDRFVVRGFARTGGGGATLGGGRVLDVAPPRRRRSDPALVETLRRLAEADAEEGLALRVARAGFAGLREDDLARQTGLARATVRDVLVRRAAAGACLEPVAGLWLAAEVGEALEARLLAALAAWHDEDPLQPGMPRAALAGALPGNVAAGVGDALVARLAARGALEEEEARVRLADFVPILTQRQEAIAAHLRADAMMAGLEPPTPREWSEALGVPEEELRPVLAHLERDGSLVRAPGDLWFDRGAVDALREAVVSRLEGGGELATPDYKTLIGTSRKWAVPLMELFDAEHLTVRRGEARVLRRRPRPG